MPLPPTIATPPPFTSLDGGGGGGGGGTSLFDDDGPSMMGFCKAYMMTEWDARTCRRPRVAGRERETSFPSMARGARDQI